MFLFLCLSLAFAQTPRWVGFEIVGQRTLERERLAAEIPIAIGSAYAPDLPAWKATCDKIKIKFDLAAAECSAVTYLDQGSYFVLDVVERGDEDRLRFRQAGTADLRLVAPRVISAYDRRVARRNRMFAEGRAAEELNAGDFLDYDDPEMHQCALELAALTPSHHDELRAILNDGSHADERARAADLLNWAGHLEEDVVLAGRLADDPDKVVRNNLTRFAVAFVSRVRAPESREELIRSFARQLERPTHGDRNKAVYALLDILKAFPEDKPKVARYARVALERLARQSVLMNVRDPAREILSKI